MGAETVSFLAFFNGVASGIPYKICGNSTIKRKGKRAKAKPEIMWFGSESIKMRFTG